MKQPQYGGCESLSLINLINLLCISTVILLGKGPNSILAARMKPIDWKRLECEKDIIQTGSHVLDF